MADLFNKDLGGLYGYEFTFSHTQNGDPNNSTSDEFLLYKKSSVLFVIQATNQQFRLRPQVFLAGQWHNLISSWYTSNTFFTLGPEERVFVGIPYRFAFAVNNNSARGMLRVEVRL